MNSASMYNVCPFIQFNLHIKLFIYPVECAFYRCGGGLDCCPATIVRTIVSPTKIYCSSRNPKVIQLNQVVFTRSLILLFLFHVLRQHIWSADLFSTFMQNLLISACFTSHGNTSSYYSTQTQEFYYYLTLHQRSCTNSTGSLEWKSYMIVRL